MSLKYFRKNFYENKCVFSLITACIKKSIKSNIKIAFNIFMNVALFEDSYGYSFGGFYQSNSSSSLTSKAKQSY